jgi:hypothetical protein
MESEMRDGKFKTVSKVIQFNHHFLGFTITGNIVIWSNWMNFARWWTSVDGRAPLGMRFVMWKLWWFRWLTPKGRLRMIESMEGSLVAARKFKAERRLSVSHDVILYEHWERRLLNLLEDYRD